MTKRTVVPEGEWKPLPDKRTVVLESDNDSDPPLEPPSLPTGKARPIARRKKPTDAKLDEDDMPAMGAFGLFEGARSQCKTTAVPALWEEHSDGETTVGSDTDVVDISGAESDSLEYLDQSPQMMELDFEAFSPTPSQQPRGDYKPKRDLNILVED